MAEKLDPFDVEALGNAVNDSAGRVSTIWVSFLIFALYLLVAATTVTDRQLFLAEPVKLPVLNIDLPLWGFFFLAPILFVIFHIYVLLQVMLLARTAAAYNDAVERAAQRDNMRPADDASLRQRLDNTLFAQIFAGSPRERRGWLGWLLKAMAWITLVAAPILILVVFQFAFLPYHSHIATWTHRLLILAELIVAFTLWPLVLNSQRDFVWNGVRAQLKRITVLPLRLFGPKEARREEWEWLKQQRVGLACCVLYVVVCWSVATFPGEPHVNLFTRQRLSSVQCDRWIQQQFPFADLRFDRIIVPHVDAIDHQKLEQIEKETKANGEAPYQGERMRSVRDRDLNCADFSDFADLQRIDWTGAHLKNANFATAKLQGATLEKAALQGASLKNAQLQGASLKSAQLQDAFLDEAESRGVLLDGAQLQGASLKRAQLQGASLYLAGLQGAVLDGAQLQGAFLYYAHLQGASFDYANLRGATLDYTELQGASLNSAELQGASLDGATLQGGSLNHAHLQGASLYYTELQGAELTDAEFDDAILDVWNWRARNPACSTAQVIGHPEAVIDVVLRDQRVEEMWITSGAKLVQLLPPLGAKLEELPATPDVVAKFIERSIADIPGTQLKEAAATRMRAGLVVDPTHDDTALIAKVWDGCQNSPTSTMSLEKFDREHAELLRGLVCDATDAAGATAIFRKWIYRYPELTRSLLGGDTGCAVTKDLDEATVNELRELAAPFEPTPTPSK